MASLKVARTIGESRRSSKQPVWVLLAAAATGVAIVVITTLFLWRHSGSSTAQAVGDLAILVAVTVAAGSLATAAYKATQERLAWAMLTLAAAVWATAQTIYTAYGIILDHAYPFPSIADLGYLGYALPATVALFAFPRASQRLSSRLRTLLDAAVIALGILFVSWATVLHSVYEAGGADWLTRIVGLGYPIVDVLVLSVVLTLGMRRPAGQRLPWLFLGGGLALLAVMDSLFVFRIYAGDTGLTGSPMVGGWMTAWLLVALAPWVPRSRASATVRREVALAIELVPYVPALFAFVVAAQVVLSGDRFLLVSGAILLVALGSRQVMIVYANVTLTRDLEAKVAIVNSSPDAILSKTVEGVVTTWNPGAERLYGWTADEMIGRNVGALVPEHRRGEEDAVVDRVRGGAQVKIESERLRKDGSIVPVALTVSPIFDAETVVGMASIQQDITKRRANDVALARAREEALEAVQLKSEFLATMSHEIRTPMNGVIGLTGLLLETSLDETQRQYAEGVQGAGEALLAVINDILDFSKLEAGKVELEVGAFDPRQLVDEVAALLAPAAQPKRLELIAYCLPEVPAMVVGDCGRIRQILLNLSSNAVKFTESGEVVVKVRSAPGDGGEAMVRFEVSDTGIGIAAADAERLFESFSQADASTTRRYGGTGLGLAISRRLTEAMGGQIGVDSTEGAGSTFWFELPLPVGDAPTDRAVLAPDLLHGVRVLVVDDNATNRLILQSQLTAWQMSPQVADGAAAALALLRDAAADRKPYQVAVLDMCMPDMDGLELAQLINTDRTLSGTRLIMLTSTMQVDTGELKQAGIGEWLTKPVRSSELYDRLMRLMAPPTTVMAASPPSTSTPQPAPSGSLGRVLVVEDNALNQLVAEGVVTKLGYQVDIVANGAEALDAIAATSYSAVLMDCHMPVMDGFEATRQIRANHIGNYRIPIIAMTAGAMAEDRERCLAIGMDDYVSKPVNVTALQTALTRWARQHALSIDQ